MDTISMGIAAFKFLIGAIPPDKPPGIDYEGLRKINNEYYDKLSEIVTSPMKTPKKEITVNVPVIEAHAEVKQLPERATATGAPVATSCIACSRSHMVTIAGALEESMRFARENGITDPDVIKRIDAAEKEINIMERIDLSPEAILNSPEKDKEMANFFLPKIRKLRQDIGQIATVDQLEAAAAEASIVSQEFRLRQMEMNGANLSPIITLAKKVQDGEISMEEAREQVKQYLPKGG